MNHAIESWAKHAVEDRTLPGQDDPRPVVCMFAGHWTRITWAIQFEGDRVPSLLMRPVETESRATG